MPVNAHPEYIQAEKEYDLAETLEEKLEALEKMLSYVPGHKGAENLRAQLRQRYKKLKEQLLKSKKAGKSSKEGIKKQGHQIVILGKTNSGKSTLISLFTNAQPRISDVFFTTTYPLVGMFELETIKMQLVENPAIGSYFYDKSLAKSSDALIITINSLEDLEKFKEIQKSEDKKIILFNLKEKLNENQKRKLIETLNSKKLNFVLISLKESEQEELDKLKNKIFQTFDKIRVYTKEPDKKQKSEKPIILNPDSSIKDAAEKILKGFSQKIKQTKIWGPSSKFSGQVVGLQHKLKDLDVLEFKTY